jgi:hypothetical protein
MSSGNAGYPVGKDHGTDLVIRFPGHPALEYLSSTRYVQEEFLEIDVLVPELQDREASNMKEQSNKMNRYRYDRISKPNVLEKRPLSLATHGIHPRQQCHRPIIHVPRMIHIPCLQFHLGIPQPSIHRSGINIQSSFKDGPTPLEFILIRFPLSILDPFSQRRPRVANTFFEFLSFSSLIFA